ncbi:MAG: DUF1836 domain-containing protein [Clostridium sp.]|uniref:DUF1836 domain-containing protein n=1 Tax=Clostridium culturomicium TaxID=1499683 RepID=UPI00058C8CFB|nr:DUF1836 domain-containing protein [Clostridium culturomicium]MDU4890466.1 DUF1836 domain-containing protein [Clostridium sp.]MDU7084092.1 DUF1836 domain-containing protein [Clostridium sp.]
MENQINENRIENILDFHCPRFKELPNVPLYKDQVILYIENALRPINITSDEKLLTPTMLNNYVKQKVVSPPKNKRYNEKHLAYLIVVCILKQVYSLTEVCELIKIQIATCPIEEAYDYFCLELEKILKAVFTTRDFTEPSSAKKLTFEGEIVRSTIMAYANKLFIQNYLLEMAENQEEVTK